MRLRISTAVLVVLAALAANAIAQEAPPPIRRDFPSGFLPEPTTMTDALDEAGMFLKGDRRDREPGVYPVFESGVTGAGWISLGGGYRRLGLNRHAVLDGSASYSWRGYKTLQGKAELFDLAGGHITLGSQAMYQDITQLQYFGIGHDSNVFNRSDYRLQTRNAVAYGIVRPARWLSAGVRFGYLARPTISSSTGPFDRGFRDSAISFAGDPGFNLTRQPNFVHSEGFVTVDFRDYPGHPSRGGVYNFSASKYVDRTLDMFGFGRYEVEAAQFVPLSSHGWVLAFHGWTVISDTEPGQQIPVYLMPSLGGSTTLRAYSDYRFHDRNLLLVSAESRWALFKHVDLVIFADAGSVAGRPRDLDLAKSAYGFGLRTHNHTSTTARLDLAYGGDEGRRILFRINDPFRLTRLARYTAAIPFLP